MCDDPKGAPRCTHKTYAGGHAVTIEAASHCNSMISMGHKGDAEEIATVVRFLCGPAASYVTGQSLQINGGERMF